MAFSYHYHSFSGLRIEQVIAYFSHLCAPYHSGKSRLDKTHTSWILIIMIIIGNRHNDDSIRIMAQNSLVWIKLKTNAGCGSRNTSKRGKHRDREILVDEETVNICPILICAIRFYVFLLASIRSSQFLWNCCFDATGLCSAAVVYALVSSLLWHIFIVNIIVLEQNVGFSVSSYIYYI